MKKAKIMILLSLVILIINYSQIAIWGKTTTSSSIAISSTTSSSITSSAITSSSTTGSAIKSSSTTGSAIINNSTTSSSKTIGGKPSNSTASSSTTYKVLITAKTLNVRSKATTASSINSVFYLGDIVDIIGSSGNFLKTSKGFISKNYTRKIQGMYIKVKSDIKLLNEGTLTPMDRTAITTKSYLIVGSKKDNILINVGRARGYIPQTAIRAIADGKTDKLTIGWENITNKVSITKLCQDNTSYVNTKSDTIGLDILSPTWFDLAGDANKPNSITINNIADKDYIKRAHSNGYEVWPRLGEMNKTRAAVEFNNSSVRNRLIKQINALATTYDIDGINIDYEALGSNNKNGFTSFMKALYPVLKKNNLKVSIDVTKYTTLSPLYSLCYDRPQLSKYSDYLVLMGYDEHVASSTEPGSVASYNWVSSAITDMIAQGVSVDKLILGVPFYLRDYTVISYDSIVFNKTGKIYKVPLLADNNKLSDGKGGSTYNVVGIDNDWYKVNVNGVIGYISKNSGAYSTNTDNSTTGSAIDTTNGGISVTNSGITTTNTGVTVTGSSINTTTTGTSITTNSAINPQNRATITLKSNTPIYKSEYKQEINKLADENKNSYFKYKGQVNDFYIIDFKGANAYVPKTQASLVKADTKVIGSSAISMVEANRRLQVYSGSTAQDELAKQNIAIYYINDTQHQVWLETPDSMAWRMDMANDNELAGIAIWSLNWKPIDGIWSTILNKMKN